MPRCRPRLGRWPRESPRSGDGVDDFAGAPVFDGTMRPEVMACSAVPAAWSSRPAAIRGQGTVRRAAGGAARARRPVGGRFEPGEHLTRASTLGGRVAEPGQRGGGVGLATLPGRTGSDARAGPAPAAATPAPRRGRARRVSRAPSPSRAQRPAFLGGGLDQRAARLRGDPLRGPGDIRRPAGNHPPVSSLPALVCRHQAAISAWPVSRAACAPVRRYAEAA